MIIQGAYQLCGGDDARAMSIASSRSILGQETSDTRNTDTYYIGTHLNSISIRHEK